jgi:hypothetical protein
MKRVIALSVCLTIATSVFAGVPSNKAVYRGGTIAGLKQDVEAKPDYSNPNGFTFAGAVIPYDKIQSIEYGQKAGRRIGAAVATAIIVSPLGLFMLMSKKRKHMVSVTWTGADGKGEAAVFEFGKGGVRQALKILEAKSGKQVEYESEDAKKNIGQ